MAAIDPRTAPTLRIARGNPSHRAPLAELTTRVARLIAGKSLGRLPVDVADRIIAHIVNDLRTKPVAELDARLADAMEDAWAFELGEDDQDMRRECAPEQAQRGQCGGAA